MKRIIHLSIFLSAVLLVACNQTQPLPTPTLLPTVAFPTEPAVTATSLPPTIDLGATVTQAAQATAVPTATYRPTQTPEPLSPVISLTSPGEGVQLVMGSDIVAGGLAQLNPKESVYLRLVSANGRTLTETVAIISEVNTWQASLRVPVNVSGPAQLQATIRNQKGEVLALDYVGVILALDTTLGGRYLALFRPLNGENAVSGYYLFFDGYAQLAGGGVTISLWTDNCQNRVAQQFFAIRNSSYWRGFLVVPRNLVGPACAVAYFGSPEEPDGWREAQVPINILAADDPDAAGARAVMIGFPASGATISAAEPLQLYGTAYNAPNNEVLVSILLDNGRILTEGIATVDDFGYWELTLILLPDTAGEAQITASIGTPTDSDYAQAQTTVTIVAAEE